MKRIIPLSKEQIALVEENLSVIDTVIFSRIIIDKKKFGMDYDELYQEGALLLCNAAMKYDKRKNDSFKAFAFIVIRNGLVSYCKKMSKKNKTFLEYTEKIIKSAETDMSDTIMQNKIIELDVLFFLEDLRKNYTGSARLGIEALIWKVKGLSGSEIADKYNVTPNLVGAWISRAVKKLQNDSVFNLYMEDLLDKKAS